MNGLTRGLIRGENRGLIRGLAHELEDESVLASIPSRMVPLASEHTGLTAKSQPVLLWYVSDPWPGKIEFALNKVGEPDPLFQTRIDGPEKEGVYQISLADYNVTLEHDTEYEWFLAIVVDPYERSADFLASATVRYVNPSAELSGRLSGTPENELPYVYAENGYWYDMIESLSELIADVNPGYRQMKAQRGALLKQVNLPLAVAYDIN
ncbi:MAG: DUF928 domain-containing protein [Desulfobacteraceae bacterium]|nr:DUF928 domain-containing protein [Desulfobacteraceae bacterium]